MKIRSRLLVPIHQSDGSGISIGVHKVNNPISFARVDMKAKTFSKRCHVAAYTLARVPKASADVDWHCSTFSRRWE